MEYLKWDTIPPHILVEIYSYLKPNDRLTLSLVCKNWSEVFHDAQLWTHFSFKFDTEKYDEEAKSIVCMERYSEGLKYIEIFVNQSQPKSIQSAILVIDKLISLDQWKLIHFKFNFIGENPLCFNGKNILDKIKSLLSSIDAKELIFSLRVLNLSKLNIVLDDAMLDILTTSHCALRVIHIQNSCLVDNITYPGILRLVQACQQLEELYVFYHCMNDDVIKALAESGRSRLKVLSLMCNRSDKYNSMVSSDAWNALRITNPSIEVIMKFDSTMPRHMINPIFCRGIPVTKIDLHLFSWLDEEIEHIAQICNSTLEYLSCHTSLDPNSHANPELLPALIHLVSNCKNLNELHCHCKIPESTIQKIHSLGKLKKYTLYSEDLPRI